jgi:hypothetical protein
LNELSNKERIKKIACEGSPNGRHHAQSPRQPYQQKRSLETISFNAEKFKTINILLFPHFFFSQPYPFCDSVLRVLSLVTSTKQTSTSYGCPVGSCTGERTVWRAHASALQARVSAAALVGGRSRSGRPRRAHVAAASECASGGHGQACGCEE